MIAIAASAILSVTSLAVTLVTRLYYVRTQERYRIHFGSWRSHGLQSVSTMLRHFRAESGSTTIQPELV
jgi:hypothetical protein